MDSVKKRSRYQIISAILHATIGGATITKIVYEANLNFKVAKEYVNFLIEVEFISVQSRNGRTIYETTEEGRKFLKNFQTSKI